MYSVMSKYIETRKREKRRGYVGNKNKFDEKVVVQGWADGPIKTRVRGLFGLF